MHARHATEDPHERHETRDPEHLRSHGSGGDEPLELTGERESDHEDVPVACAERGEHAVEESVLPARHPPAPSFALLAPGHHGEGAEDPCAEPRERRPAGRASGSCDARRDPSEDTEMHDRVPADVEPVPQA